MQHTNNPNISVSLFLVASFQIPVFRYQALRVYFREHFFFLVVLLIELIKLSSAMLRDRQNINHYNK